VKRYGCIFAGLMFSIGIIPSLSAQVFIQRPEVRQFIAEIAKEHNIDIKMANLALGQISSSEEIIKRMNTQYEALPWHKYRKLLINQQRIHGGRSFMKEYATVLKKAETEYGVPAELIVAIIGIESTYGKIHGKYPVLQSLATLAFDYPRRADFFRNELKEYLLLVTEQGLDPLAIKGSYAGAMGMPQFIASSYRKFAVDFDNSGTIDLMNNIPQVIGSVANYFKVHGWETGKPVVHKAFPKNEKHKKLPIAVASEPKPTLSLITILQHDITYPEISTPDINVAWLEFEGEQNKEYWLGMENFYVITRYNRSSNYALAAHQLGTAIAQE